MRDEDRKPHPSPSPWSGSPSRRRPLRDPSGFPSPDGADPGPVPRPRGLGPRAALAGQHPQRPVHMGQEQKRGTPARAKPVSWAHAPEGSRPSHSQTPTAPAPIPPAIGARELPGRVCRWLPEAHLSRRGCLCPRSWPGGSPQPVGLLLEPHLHCRNRTAPPRRPRGQRTRASPRRLQVGRTGSSPEEGRGARCQRQGTSGGQGSRAKTKERENLDTGRPRQTSNVLTEWPWLPPHGSPDPPFRPCSHLQSTSPPRGRGPCAPCARQAALRPSGHTSLAEGVRGREEGARPHGCHQGGLRWALGQASEAGHLGTYPRGEAWTPTLGSQSGGQGDRCPGSP